MENIPNAEEFIDKNRDISTDFDYETSRLLIGFAKLHVKAALENAANSASITPIMRECDCEISKTSILNAYPESNIK